MVICLERDADLHMAQVMPLPLTVSCFGKMQIGFTFLVPAYLSSPGLLDGCSSSFIHRRKDVCPVTNLLTCNCEPWPILESHLVSLEGRLANFS